MTAVRTCCTIDGIPLDSLVGLSTKLCTRCLNDLVFLLLDELEKRDER